MEIAHRDVPTVTFRSMFSGSTHTHTHSYVAILFLVVGLVFANSANADLLPCGKVNYGGAINAPGGCIEKTLLEQIGVGHGDNSTPYSSVYLIKRDPARSIRRGRQLFQRKWSADEGLGPRVNPGSTGDITQNAALGAGVADSCAACHARPRGAAGFGGDVSTRPDSRDAPHLFGLGLTEQLADQMTTSLRTQRDRAIQRANSRGRCVTKRLRANGVSFGRIKACPNGEIDVSGVEGVDADLRIKPFFHDGRSISIREFIISAFNDEMGLQAPDSVLCAVTDPDNPQTVVSPSGFIFDPSKDRFERPMVCDSGTDLDNDAVVNEVDTALIDHMEFYFLNYFKPGQYRVTREARRGAWLMESFGCNSCHTPSMTVSNDRRIADVETVYDPEKGIFNELFATATTQFTAVSDNISEFPQLLPTGDDFVVNNFYSDLKRHDLGPAFHERNFDGSVTKEFVTEPLWGVGSTAPYGHDGRSINLDSVILRHGGEAQRAKLAYVLSGENSQRALRSFLETLVLFPPDDTASNLNPGQPADDANIQSPAIHGSINLGALFQINPEVGE